MIDFCLVKQLVTDPKTNFQCLELSWASKVNCQQRAGRTGRIMDGRVYRLVPKNFYDVSIILKFFKRNKYKNVFCINEEIIFNH